MFVETVIGLGMIGSIGLNLTSDHRERKREIKEIKNKWNILMDSLGSAVENKIDQRYSVLDVFVKHYGFDSIISLPSGTSTIDLRKLLPKIDVVYAGESIVEPSNDGKSAYLRIHVKGREINSKDKAKMKWYSYFQDNKFRNNSGETYQLTKGKDIINPNDEKLIIGSKYVIKIPNGLTYESLKNEEIELSKLYGLCQIEFDAKSRDITCELIDEKVPDTEQFVPIKVNPWEMLIGMEYNWNHIILDYSVTPNGLIAGRVGSGKTVAMITGILNLVCTCDNFELYIAMIGEKQDLAIFKNTRQTRYYAQSATDTIRLINYLTKEMNRRNKLFSSCDKMCFNIKRYNSIVGKEKQLPYIHFIVDELADLMEDTSIQGILWNLIRKSRSAGIYLTLASQRFSLANVSAEVKAGLTCKICFKISNTASALTVVSGEGLAQRIVSLEPTREFLVDYQEGIKIGKTLQLTEDYMIELMKDKLEDNKIKLDLTGNIIEEIEANSEESPKYEQKEEEIEEKPKKESRFSQYVAKKTKKEQENAKREAYLREMKEKILNNSIEVGEKSGD